MNQLDYPRVTGSEWIRLFLSVGAFILVMALLFLTNCSRHPVEPEPIPIVPPDTVVVVDTVFVHEHHDHEISVACDTFDLDIVFTVVGDQSAPNVYAYFKNGVELGRFIITDTYAEPTNLPFLVMFERITLGDVITIKKIEGSRAEAIGSAIVGIRCSGG